jgi:2-dehydropantoate 2-reductase
VARGAHLVALRERGLELRIGEQRVRVQPVCAVENPAQAGMDFELIIFAVKTYDSAAAIEALRTAVGPGTAVLALQNGVDSIEELALAFGPEHVLAGPSYIISALVEPGVVETAPPRRMVLAELAGPPTPRLEAIASAIREVGVDVTLGDDARRALWEKFVPQAANATISSVCQLPLGMVRDTPEGFELYRALMGESCAVGRACGVALPPGFEESTLAAFMSVPPTATSSMQRDFQARRRVELEHLTGAVVRRGQAHGVPTPGFDALYAVLKVQALAFGGLQSVPLETRPVVGA